MFDSHIHYDEAIVPAAGLLLSMDAVGIERAALIAPLTPDMEPTLLTRAAPYLMRGLNTSSRSLRWAVRAVYRNVVKGDGRVDIGGKIYQVLPQPDNDPICQAVASYPDRFVGWIFINPTGPIEPVDEIERCLATPGMIGVKCHPYWHGYPVSKLVTTAEYCQQRGLPMLIHLGARTGGDFTALPERFPDLTVVYAHAGVPYQRRVCDYARLKKNVYVDLSSPTYVDAAGAAAAVRRAGASKCLFGTDGPYFHHAAGRVDLGLSLEIYQSLALSKADRRRVGWENFTAIVDRR